MKETHNSLAVDHKPLHLHPCRLPSITMPRRRGKRHRGQRGKDWKAKKEPKSETKNGGGSNLVCLSTLSWASPNPTHTHTHTSTPTDRHTLTNGTRYVKPESLKGNHFLQRAALVHVYAARCNRSDTKLCQCVKLQDS